MSDSFVHVGPLRDPFHPLLVFSATRKLKRCQAPPHWAPSQEHQGQCRTCDQPPAATAGSQRNAAPSDGPRLIDAGLNLFVESGASGVTMRAVCARARLNDRYFYEHFTASDTLLEATSLGSGSPAAAAPRSSSSGYSTTRPSFAATTSGQHRSRSDDFRACARFGRRCDDASTEGDARSSATFVGFPIQGTTESPGAPVFASFAASRCILVWAHTRGASGNAIDGGGCGELFGR